MQSIEHVRYGGHTSGSARCLIVKGLWEVSRCGSERRIMGQEKVINLFLANDFDVTPPPDAPIFQPASNRSEQWVLNVDQEGY